MSFRISNRNSLGDTIIQLEHKSHSVERDGSDIDSFVLNFISLL